MLNYTRNMPKKTIIFLSLALLTLVIWIYRSSIAEYNNTIIYLKERHSTFNPLIYPQNTTCHTSPFIVIIVTSYVGHVELRSAHRRAMPYEKLTKLNITRIFLLAKIPPNERYITQESINDESKTFGDILQGSFYENYRNLTYKHLMGLQWASNICNKASYVLKVDDDTVFNIDTTYAMLTKVPDNNRQDLIMGYILNSTKPRRNKENKWYVTWEEYPRQIYPPYLSGWYYIMHIKVAAKVYEEAKYHPYFWIDDIYVTGILTESLGLKLYQLPQNYWLEYYELLECCLRDMVTKFVICDYGVGPNGGRNNLIVEFNDAYSVCQKWNNCTIRQPNQDLIKHCVIYRDRTLFGDGQAEIKHVTL